MRLEEFTQIDPVVGAVILNTHGLTYSERETVKLLLGLGDGFRHSYEQISDVLRVSIDQVQALEANAARKLQEVVLSVDE